jgi:hypothetical protein
MKLRNTFIATALLLSVTSVQAELVETNLSNMGDRLATLDTDTGIEWLDLTQTRGMSINHVESLFSGRFSYGWRFPTAAEVLEMLGHAFPSMASPTFNIGSWNVTNSTTDNEADRFRFLFGTTHSNPTASSPDDYTFGLHRTDFLPHPSGFPQTLSVGHSGVRDWRNNESVSYSSNYPLTYDYNYSHYVMGVFLVSDGGSTLSSYINPSQNINNPNSPAALAAAAAANVSSPVLLGLMGLGLLGFSARRRSSSTSKVSVI